MYLNVLSFKSGRTLAFKSEIPFSLDKIAPEIGSGPEWVCVTDEDNGQIISFKTSEVVTIANAPYNPKTSPKPGRKRPGIKTEIIQE